MAQRLARDLEILMLAAMLGIPGPVWARQDEKPGGSQPRQGVGVPQGRAPEVSAPPMLEGVLKAMEAPYLKDEEKAQLRVFHGVWLASDLADPRLRAQAALSACVWDDASLDNPAAAIEDRAEARLLRGEPSQALELLTGAKSARAVRIRAEALELLGQTAEADAAEDPLVSLLTRQSVTAPEIVEGVRALRVRGRIRGQSAQDYGRMMALLSHAWEDLDRLYWPAVLEQARILADKDNAADAEKAARQVLAMNPACAAAWRLLGELSVSAFSFDATERIAARLRSVAARLDEGASGSVDADLIMAMARMRQNAPEDAAAEIGRTLARFPHQREALALGCAVEALRFDWDKVEASLAAFDKLAAVGPTEKTGSPLAVLAVGHALSETRQYAKAAEYLNRAAARAPNMPEPFVELGLLEMQSGRDIPAKDALTIATKLDPFHVRARNSLELLTELLKYDTVQSEHFVVRYRPGEDAVVAKELLGPLEDSIFKVVCGTFKHEPPGRTVIELMPDHEWFAVRITGMPGIHTIAASTGPLIAMEAPREGQGHFGVYDWVRVVRHEFTHTVNLSQTNNRIPHWFTEAAAVNLELAPYDFATCQLLVSCLLNDTLFDLREINEAFVRPKKQTDRQQAYMQGNWMYRYIVDKWGSDAPLKLMALYAKGQRESEAFPTVLGITTEQFLIDFRAWAARDASTWGMLPSPSLDELRLTAMMSDQAERTGLSERLQQVSAIAAGQIAGLAPTGDEAPSTDIELAPARPEQVEAWLKEHPEHPDLLELKLMDTLNVAGGEAKEEMIPLLEAYAKARPVDPSPHRQLARLYLASSDPARAIPHLEFLDIREQYAPVYAAALAKQYAAIGDLDKAWAKIQRATQIAGYDAALREQAATIALQRKQPKDALRHIEALTVLEPKQEIHRKRLDAVRKMVEAP